jgi:hypothetical protein
MDMTPCILAVIELWGKHTVSAFSVYFLTAQNLKMEYDSPKTSTTIYRFTRQHIPADLNLINNAQKLKALNSYIIRIKH